MKIANLALLGILSLPIFSAEFITIGTGGVTGTYYPTGGAICSLVNKYTKTTQIRCSVEATNGSVYNINAINNEELDFGLVQSDVVYQAVNGIGSFKNNRVKKLRSVIAIYPELLTLVTRRDANINSLDDLKGKRINIGNLGSGQEASTNLLFRESNIDKSILKFASSLKASEMPDALRDNKIDGYFYMVGHPTENIIEAANSVDIKLVSITGSNIYKLLQKYPYYQKASIPAGMYKGNPEETKTYGAKAVLVTNENTSEKAVYTLVKAILSNFDAFKQLHPAYSNITKESLLDGLSAPQHEGAKRYFKEKGLL
ncbi:MAG: TAXI family TRAP transporter solute-binding subunit [Campylobacteraceae bacterium]|nr:TAXI family TRAP transporter solute-binding subunit [Campylobacteraceae bacterium]